ncbi:flagellar filament capping protein FliD [Limnobacter sp.]|uniref:flagellar filament capping protein FliD n=1 Tax=Limnobacter sp. TaxID=2003368 RepID=UPI00351514FF
MGISASGLGSGLDINGIVGQLVRLERAKFTPKAAKQAEFRERISQFGALKSNLTNLQDAGKKLTELSKGSQKTTNSDPTVLDVTLQNNTIGTYEFNISTLAGRQAVQSTTFTNGNIVDGGNANAVLTFDLDPLNNAGADFTVDVASTGGQYSLTAIADAINAKAGLKESVQARVETLAGTSERRLVIESKNTGAAQSFSITSSIAELDVLAFDAAAPASNPDMLRTQEAKNAAVTINGEPFSSASNQFNSTISGITFTAQKVGSSTVTGSFGIDNTALKTRLTDFVSAYNKTITFLKLSQGKDAKLGREALPGQVEQGIRRVLAEGALEQTMADYGLKIDKEGVMVFDQSAKFDAKVQADPNSAIEFFAGSASQPKGLLKKLDSYLADTIKAGGPLALRNDSLNAAIRRIDDDRLRFDQRMGRLEKSLFKQFTALDASLASLQASQNLLSQRLGALQAQQQNN